MPFEFFVLGIITIVEGFCIKNRTKLFFCAGLVMILLSYFVDEIRFNKVSIDYFVLIGLVIVLVLSLKNINILQLKRVLTFLFVNLATYVVAISLSSTFLLQFNILPFFISTFVCGLFLKEQNPMFAYLVLSGVLGEIISCFVSFKHFEYFAFFEWNFYKYFVCLLATFWILSNITNMAKNKHKNSENILLDRSVSYEKE